MNAEFPPLSLTAPILNDRRREPSRPVPTSPEVIARREAIAARLRDQVAPLARRLRGLTDAERKAVFYKLEHDGPVDARKLGLKPLAEPTDRFTVAIPRDDLAGFEQNIDRFAMGEVANGMVPKAQIARITTFAEASPTDRLSQELFEHYDELVKRPYLIVEVELLSVAAGGNQRRDELIDLRTRLQRSIAPDGVIFEHEEMAGSCRAVIRCSGAAFRTLVEAPEWQRSIVWFEPRPEFQTFLQIVQNFNVRALGAFTSPVADAPVVCVVDTGVSAGNPFLRPTTRDELVRSFLRSKPDNGSDEYGHGSGIASLVAYYALNIAPGGTNTARVWIASARVLDENNNSEERLFSAALKEVVEFFAPRGVKIFNLSVNIRNRRWNQDAKRTMPRRSWIARRIDRLSRAHDVVFVVSAGNIDKLDVRDSYSSGIEYPKYLVGDDASLLDPAQAALALTVGSVAMENTVVGPAPGAQAIAVQGHPSPFTRSGPGIGREIKPELVDYGGNFIYEREGTLVRENLGCSVPVASNTLTPALTYSNGTSLAAPRVAHKLALVLQDLRLMNVSPSAALLKAFIVNSARLPVTQEQLEAFVPALSERPKDFLNVFGYGFPDADRATSCDPYSVVMYHQGEIEPDKIAFLEIPVPASLQGAGNGLKRLSVTVVQMPEVQQWGLEQYLGTVFKWRMFRGDVRRDDVVAAMSRPEEEDANAPDLPQELPFGIKLTQRSRGAVQHDVWEWKQHRAEFSEHHYTLAIAAFRRWTRRTAPVPYAVVVRLEETTRSTAIYTEVRNALVELQVQARA